MTKYAPLEILEADGASRLHISIVARDGYLFAEVPLTYYQSGLNNLERINHPDNAPDKEKAEFIVTVCNTYEALLRALEEINAASSYNYEVSEFYNKVIDISSKALKLAKGEIG